MEYLIIINIILLNIISGGILLYNNNIKELIYINNIIGIDSLSLSMLWLTIIIYITIWYVPKEYKKILKSDNGWKIIILWILLLISFITINILIYYILFELILLPLFWLIIKQSKKTITHIEASLRLFIWTMIGSVIFIISLIYIYMTYGTYSIMIYKYIMPNWGEKTNILISLSIILPFIIKMPSYPFINWLPYAHTEATTQISVLLAGLILKLAPYGIIRFINIINNNILITITKYIWIIGIISIIVPITILIYINDLKKIIAYSSIIHMNISLIGILLYNMTSYNSVILSIYAHGLISSGLFLLINFIYIRYETRSITYLKGLSILFPNYTLWLSIFILLNISFPINLNIISELLLLYSLYIYNIYLTYGLLILLWIFSSICIYNLVKIIYSKLSHSLNLTLDLYYIEILPLLLLSFLVINLGLWGINPLLLFINNSLLYILL